MHVVPEFTTRRDCHIYTTMSDAQDNSPAPRRSQRDRKLVQPFISGAID